MGNRQIDLHVGLRLRQRRMALGITQADLAKSVGLTFQQIQKYESGANQLVSSRLYEIAAALGITVSFLFEGLGRSERSGGTNPEGLSLLATTEAQRLILSYWRIGTPSVRKHVRDLIQSLSEAGPEGSGEFVLQKRGKTGKRRPSSGASVKTTRKSWAKS